MAKVWRSLAPTPDLQDAHIGLQDVMWALSGISDHGLPIALTKYDGTSYAHDVMSAETGSGNSFRARSQNTTYGITLNNAGLNIVGAPAFAAFTTGSILFIGPGHVLTEDQANLRYDDASNGLTVGGNIVGAASLNLTGVANMGTAATVSGSLLVGGAATFNSHLTSLGTHFSAGDFWVGPTAAGLVSILAASGDYASTGKISLTPAAAITTFKRQFESTFTWNNGTTAMNAMTLALTDTSSGTTSTFFDCLSTSASKFSIRKDGAVQASGYFNSVVGATLPVTGTGLAMLYDTAGRLYCQDFSGTTMKALVIRGGPVYVGGTTGDSVSFYGVGGGVAQQTVSGAAANSSSNIQLTNDIRTALVTLGLVR